MNPLNSEIATSKYLSQTRFYNILWFISIFCHSYQYETLVYCVSLFKCIISPFLDIYLNVNFAPICALQKVHIRIYYVAYDLRFICIDHASED